MIRSSNPALNERVFRSAHAVTSGETMTLEGTVNKTIISILLTVAAAYWSWSNPMVMAQPMMLFGSLIIGTIIAFVVIFKNSLAPVLTPVYAVVEGFMLGAISLMYAVQFSDDPASVLTGAASPNTSIVFQAVSLTFGTLFCLLMAYKSGMIKATENFKLGVAAATGAIFFVYLISMILSLFSVQVPLLHSSGPFGILISLVIVVVAALNLVLDFDFIENASNSGSAPKYMEWYGAFGLLVTLIWLYLEILRLLAKLQSRD
ncbi:MAG: Bax inhibitor-1/YccA family protein [Bdellovibrionales bacterium]|nr:Bax inhibitor-1/YccA family protein [Bdellovibrionales bacterium]